MDILRTTGTLPTFCLFAFQGVAENLSDDLFQIDELENEASETLPEWIENFPANAAVEPEEFESIFQWFLA